VPGVVVRGLAMIEGALVNTQSVVFNSRTGANRVLSIGGLSGLEPGETILVGETENPNKISVRKTTAAFPFTRYLHVPETVGKTPTPGIFELENMTKVFFPSYHGKENTKQNMAFFNFHLDGEEVCDFTFFHNFGTPFFYLCPIFTGKQLLNNITDF
jgi:hypothetical protein